MTDLILDGENLDIDQAYEVMCDSKARISLSRDAYERVKRSREFVEKALLKGEAIYGINTGFGSLAQTRVEDEKLELLQHNLIRSHCVGVGDYFPEHTVRGALLLRVNALLRGHSGIRPSVIKLLLNLLNHNVLPRVPSTGSLGASGDLAPLAHMSLALLGEGEVIYEGKIIKAILALKQLGLKPVSLQAKEGLALINGTPFMCALGVECLSRAKNLLKCADIISMLSLEALQGTNRAFCEKLHALRPHPGQVLCARNLFKLLENSPNRDSHKDCDRVQDAYSLRCIPQVHGSCYDSWFRTRETVEIEINSVTDNPVVFEDEIISGGHFHGEPVSMVLCYLSMALCELGSISERRQNRLVNHNLSDLPPFLVEDSGLNSGWMIAHYTSAACVNENKVLAYPAVVDSIPTSADQEDHVSMGLTAGKNCLKILENLESILSIEFLIACQGLDFHSEPPGPGLKAAKDYLRKKVEFLEKDRFLKTDIEIARKILKSGELVKLVEGEIGELMV